jgi:hypothetical protein
VTSFCVSYVRITLSLSSFTKVAPSLSPHRAKYYYSLVCSGSHRTFHVIALSMPWQRTLSSLTSHLAEPRRPYRRIAPDRNILCVTTSFSCRTESCHNYRHVTFLLVTPKSRHHFHPNRPNHCRCFPRATHFRLAAAPPIIVLSFLKSRQQFVSCVAKSHHHFRCITRKSTPQEIVSISPSFFFLSPHHFRRISWSLSLSRRVTSRSKISYVVAPVVRYF